VHLAAGEQRIVLSVDSDHPAGDLGVLEGATNEDGRGQRPAVVAEGDRAGLRQLGHLGELLTLEPAGHGAVEAEGDDGLGAGDVGHPPQAGRRVDRGVRVGHREDAHVTARGGGESPAGDVLLVLTSRGAEVRMQVDEAGKDEHARDVDFSGALRRRDRRPGLGDPAPLDEHVLHGVDTAPRVDHPAPAQQQVGGRQRLVPRAFHQSTSSLPASL